MDNTPGASGSIGAEPVARVRADGHTLPLVGPDHVTNPRLFGRIPFDPVQDSHPISLLTNAPCALAAGHVLPTGGSAGRTRAEPGRLFCRSAGNGSAGAGVSARD